jgi:hypothetical protein
LQGICYWEESDKEDTEDIIENEAVDFVKNFWQSDLVSWMYRVLHKQRWQKDERNDKWVLQASW